MSSTSPLSSSEDHFRKMIEYLKLDDDNDEFLRPATTKEVASMLETSSLVDRMNFAPGIVDPTQMSAREQFNQQLKEKGKLNNKTKVYKMSSISSPNSYDDQIKKMIDLLMPKGEVHRTATAKEVASMLETSSLVDRMNFAPGIVDPTQMSAREQFNQQLKEKRKFSHNSSSLTSSNQSMAQERVSSIAEQTTVISKVSQKTVPETDRKESITEKGAPVTNVGKLTVSEEDLVKVSISDELPTNKLAIYDKIMRNVESSNRIGVVKFQLSEKEFSKVKFDPTQDRITLEVINTPFSYPSTNKDLFEVTLNFSDPQSLFHYCFRDHFAQDEIQTMEFPLLLHLKEYAEKMNPSILLFDEDHYQATIVKNIPRYGAIDSTGIYGNAFSNAEIETVLNQTTRIEKPAKFNILAMAALQVPSGMRGYPYEIEYVEALFKITFTGFYGSAQEAGNKPLTINTGRWGSGAFGNDPLLMAVIQILTAEMTGVNKLNYHLPSERSLGLIDKAKKWIQKNIYETANNQDLDIKTLCKIIVDSESFKYGASDGN